MSHGLRLHRFPCLVVAMVRARHVENLPNVRLTITNHNLEPTKSIQDVFGVVVFDVWKDFEYRIFEFLFLILYFLM